MDKSRNEFDSTEFEKRLTNLKDTQDSIQAMSAWCLQNRSYHKKVVTSWLTVLKQVKVEHRLTLFYLANDVIQYSKRKNYEFVDSWGTALQRATTMVRDEKVKQKIERIFRIWEQRGIYNEEFLSDLHGLLSINPAKKPQPTENDDEQATITVTNIKNCVRLEKETDKCFKSLSKTPLCDTETLNLLKDRRHVEDVELEVNETRAKLEHYVKALSTEIKARSILIAVLDQSDAFYHNQRGEVKVVANAYRNFGNRIKTMKRKLDELTKTLPSPIPSPDINAPSPGPADNDFVLPGEKDFDQNIFNKQTNGLTGYMDGNSLPFDINDFATGSPKSAADSQRIQSMLTDTYSMVPQPVPPVASSSASNYMNYGSGYTSQRNTSYDSHLNQYNQTMHSNTYSPIRPVPPPNNMFSNALNNVHASYTRSQSQNLYGGPNQSHAAYGANNSNTFSNQMVPPPPLPSFDNSNDVTDEYNPDSWELDMSWNTTQDSNFNQSLDAPHSPPHYERKGVNTNVIEYIDPSIQDEHLSGAGDVDHRQLILPMNGLSALGAKERGRLVDVDHRNLISLTGSPKLTDKDNTAQSPNSNITDRSTSWKKDLDLRQVATANNQINFNQFGVPPPSSFDTSLNSHSNSLVPPPSPPAMLLAQSSSLDSMDCVKPMNPPLLPAPRFQSPPLQSMKIGKAHNKSPAKSQNGRDNTESIDMEMSDEDFDALPEFQNNKSIDANTPNSANISHDSQEGALGPPPNLFGTPPPNFPDGDNFDASFGQGSHENLNDTPKRTNPFSNNPQEILHQMILQQQQQASHIGIGRQPRPLLDIPTNFNQPQIPGVSHNPFNMLNSPRGSSQFMGQSHSPQLNYRGSTPYFRNPKGNMRGGFRNNFRGGNNMRGNW